MIPIPSYAIRPISDDQIQELTDAASEPCLVLWNREEWSCECGAGYPCSHLAALLIRLAENHPEDSLLIKFTSMSGAAGESEKDAVAYGLFASQPGRQPFAGDDCS